MTTDAEPQTELRLVEIPRSLTVRELSELLNVGGVMVVKALITHGIMADVTKTIDYDTAAKVAVDFGVETVRGGEVVEEAKTSTSDLFHEEPDDPTTQQPRPAVVAMLGHVDHGKTSLLDLIRDTAVAAREAGGITQHIGAYQTSVRGDVITFLDTPGHEAFTQIRARGAEATDIAILVVAADDGLMPQTAEAIDHIRAAGVPMIIALNKIDLENANPDRVKRQLSERDVLIEEYGGDVPLIPVSAITKQGIDELLETVVALAELQELKANPDRRASGVVLEAELDRKQGARATLLVQRGTLRTGESLLVGNTWGKVKALFDFSGKRIDAAAPSTPVSVLGLQDVAEAGDRFRIMESEKTAKTRYEEAKRRREAATAQLQHAASLDSLFGEISSGETKELNLVVKTDVQGSVEPVRQSIELLSAEEVHVKVIHGAAGVVTESDVNLALAAKGIILAFNTRTAPGAQKLAEAEGVEIRHYDIIYKLLEEVEAALNGMLEPVTVAVVDAQAEVLQVFPIRKLGNIAGARVNEGTVRRNQHVRIFRADQEVSSGSISSLRRFQNDASEVQNGQEFGVGVEGYQDFEEGDRLEFYHEEQQTRVIRREPAPTRA